MSVASFCFSASIRQDNPAAVKRGDFCARRSDSVSAAGTISASLKADLIEVTADIEITDGAVHFGTALTLVRNVASRANAGAGAEAILASPAGRAVTVALAVKRFTVAPPVAQLALGTVGIDTARAAGTRLTTGTTAGNLDAKGTRRRAVKVRGTWKTGVVEAARSSGRGAIAVAVDAAEDASFPDPLFTQMSVKQSSSTSHPCPIAHGLKPESPRTQVPPQSIPVSPKFFSPSWQWWTHLPFLSHVSFSLQHLPPQRLRPFGHFLFLSLSFPFPLPLTFFLPRPFD
jgi:hypothetical protein